MKTYNLFIFLLLFSISGNLFAQVKFEKESRIKPKDVPSKALLFIDSLNLNTKVKWYLEEGLDKNSIEAKFILNKVKYSVEFDSSGNIEDVEIEVKWEGLEPHIREFISLQFKEGCSRFKIAKVQKQFTGSQNDLLSILKTCNKTEHLVVKYEIIVRCSRQKKVDLFEYLFNHEGQLISKSKIVFKNSSHLEY